MAISDVRILRSLAISESQGDKGSVQYSASQELLFLFDEKDPPFNQAFEDDNTWVNLGSAKVPQLDDEAQVKGVTVYVTRRDLSYYKDNERALLMTIRYDGKDEDGESADPPSGTDPETWQRITVSSQQITKPAVGWPTRGAVPDENAAGEGHGAQNSAGDPVDGLEEEHSLVKLVYTNTQVVNPVFTELNRYTNRCNDGEFLGGADYTVRMIGWNAEYDQKNQYWSVSVEFLYNPDGWQIRYYDAGYNEVVDLKRRAILDERGNPVSKPVPLNAGGQAQELTDPPAEPEMLELFPYKIANMSSLFVNCGI